MYTKAGPWTRDGNNSDSVGSMDDVSIDMSSYNSDDEAMECFAEQQRDHKWAMRKIVRNDPTFTTFTFYIMLKWYMIGGCWERSSLGTHS